MPFQRDVQALGPLAPVGRGFLLKQPGGISNPIHQGFVSTQQKVVLTRQDKGLARDQMRQWRVGRQAQRECIAHITKVIAALRHQRLTATPVKTHVDRHADARRASDRFDTAHQSGGLEKPGPANKTRREVGDFDSLAPGVEKLRVQHGGVGLIPLAGFGEVFDLDRKGALRLVGGGRFIPLQQGAEHRVAVKARQATPDHTTTLVNQCAEGAVTDHGHRQRGGQWRGETGGGVGKGGGLGHE